MSPLFDALVENAIRSTVLLALVALAALVLMRRSSAARRHLVWTVAFISLMLMPVFPAIFPTIAVVPPQLVPAPAPDTVVATQIEEVGQADSVAATSVQRPTEIDLPWRMIVVVAWTVGATLCLIPLLLARLRLGRMIRGGKETRLFGTAVTLCPTCQMPMAAGLWQRRILLPADATSWDGPKLRAVLAHESAHVRRRDCLWRMVGQLACALHWYNPLAWYALRRLQIEGEHACDDAVLLEGQESEGYAQQLLSIATAGRSDAILAAAAIAMARPSTLEGRLMSILDSARSRKRVTGGLVAAAGMLMVLLGVVVATVGAAERPAATTPDPAQVERLVKDAVETISTLTESDPRVKQAVQTLEGLPSAEVARALAPFMASDRQTVRRSALHIVFVGEFTDVAPAAEAMLALCDHQEDLTRGMAALALGKTQQQQAFDRIADMVQGDESAFARRCAAYALGLMGDAKALPFLKETIATDVDATVKNNADAAITMISRATGAGSASPAPAGDSVAEIIPADNPSAGEYYVGGEVARVGVYSISGPRITVKQALVSAGMDLRDLDGWSVRITRRTAEGGERFIDVDLKPLFDGKAPDRYLQAHDVLQVKAPAARETNTPRVTLASPDNGETGVDAAKVKELRITFDQPMNPKGFSWTGGGKAFPKTTGPAEWVDDRTCVLPVELEPGHDYWFSANNSSFRGFTGVNGKPAQSYPVWFQTAGGDPANPPSGQPKVKSTEPANNTLVEASVTEIRATFDQPMIQEGLAWVQIDANFPKTTGKAHWVNDRTCVLPVKLESGKQYRLSLNAAGYPGFTGANGVSAEPMVLSFATK